MTQDRMLTEDIIQDVFIEMYNNLDSIRDRKSIMFWLFKTARNEFFGMLRSKRIKKLYMESIDSEDIDIEDTNSITELYEDQELSYLISQELEKINPILREVFILKEYSGLSYKEIGSLLDIDEDLVKSRLYKVRQKLINKISKLV